MTVLSTIASDITQIHQKLNLSTDKQSVYHQQLLERLVQLLQEHAEAKERDERVLAELAAAKECGEEMLRMQKQTIDRLILHEYPIPRLFVILPDSYANWDPCNLIMERFRLHFLCECGDHYKTDADKANPPGQFSINAVAPTSPITVKSQVHLANHEGYELSRPAEFFDRYGPYVLGMLRILKHCLAVAIVAALSVALAQNNLKDVMQGVESLSKNTMEAVNTSIDFLEQKLDGNAVADGITGDGADMQEADMFSGLAALEGADLGHLDSFLRTKDVDKILGNLYRITTDQGHVKWVCLEHYRQVYPETAMVSFLQSVETNGGMFDPQLGKVTVTLKSSTAAKDFFKRLSNQAPAVYTLRVALDWKFGSENLVMLVDKIAQSNIRDLDLDLKNTGKWNPVVSAMRPGKGRYHSLLGLLSNTKIKGLAFSKVDHLGPGRRIYQLVTAFRFSRVSISWKESVSLTIPHWRISFLIAPILWI
ncbi:hypothetical protein BGX33_010621 [Mortierella sp. NVP41]|nr:hypothetical protein BGX33_010621 [Mortierella sp. NVP41]